MAFVNEKVPEADKEWFYSFNLRNPFTRELIEAIGWWTVDRERKAFLVGLGGQGSYTSELPMYYALVWGKNVILMETFSTGHGNISTGIEMRWNIPKIEAPECLLKDKDEMLNLIKEAFDAFGFAGRRRDVVKIVNFDFIATPLFVKE